MNHGLTGSEHPAVTDRVTVLTRSRSRYIAASFLLTAETDLLLPRSESDRAKL